MSHFSLQEEFEQHFLHYDVMVLAPKGFSAGRFAPYCFFLCVVVAVASIGWRCWKGAFPLLLWVASGASLGAEMLAQIQ